MPSEVLRELILELTEPDRLEIIREAGIADDRPSLLRGDAERRTSGRGRFLGNSKWRQDTPAPLTKNRSFRR